MTIATDEIIKIQRIIIILIIIIIYSSTLTGKKNFYVTLETFHSSHKSPNVQSRKLQEMKRKIKSERVCIRERERERGR